ncbi:MAG: hypothetical protein KGH89_01520 [Thaumarchaeota archaeon]|nr:hypothetical protein [Nitrososphaerota archaeon]
MKKKFVYLIVAVIAVVLSFVPVFPYLPPCPPATEPCMTPMEHVSLVGYVFSYL